MPTPDDCLQRFTAILDEHHRNGEEDARIHAEAMKQLEKAWQELEELKRKEE